MKSEISALYQELFYLDSSQKSSDKSAGRVDQSFTGESSTYVLTLLIAIPPAYPYIP